MTALKKYNKAKKNSFLIFMKKYQELLTFNFKALNIMLRNLYYIYMLKYDTDTEMM